MTVDVKPIEKKFLGIDVDKEFKKHVLLDKYHETIRAKIDFLEKNHGANTLQAEGEYTYAAKSDPPRAERMMAAESVFQDFQTSENNLIKKLERIIDKKRIEDIHDSDDNNAVSKLLEIVIAAELKMLKILESKTLDRINSVLEEQTLNDPDADLYQKKRLESFLNQYKSELKDLEMESTEFITILQLISSVKNKLSQFD